VQIRKIKSALVRTYADVERNRTLQMGAALSYYFVMALFPALIFLSAIVAFLPVAGLFDQALDLMGRFVPTEGMGIVRKVLSDAVTPNRSKFLSIGFFWIKSQAAKSIFVMEGGSCLSCSFPSLLIFANS
jgi:membrane protein